MQRLSEIYTAPRLIFAARVMGGLSCIANLALAVFCFFLRERGDWLALALCVILLLPTAAWFLALRSPLLGMKVFAATYFVVSAIWTLNEMLPCDAAQRNIYGFIVIALGDMTGLSVLSLLLAAFLFYVAHRIQSAPSPQQLSSF